MLEHSSEPRTTLWQLPLKQSSVEADTGAGLKGDEPWATCPPGAVTVTSKATFIPVITEHAENWQKGQTLCAGRKGTC